MNNQKAQTPGSDGQQHGATHWMLERVTSMALVPLTLWVIYSIITLSGPTHVDFLIWIKNPTNAGLLTVAILTSFYHAVLGLQVVIDDYIASRTLNRFKICAVKIIFSLMALACVVSIVKIAF